MTVKQLDHRAEKYIGASTDTKPTAALNNTHVMATFYEYDTGLLYITYDGTNWVVKDIDGGGGGMEVVSIATGAAAIAKAVNPAAKFRLLAITLHLSAAPTTSQNFVATLDAGDGTAYDTVLITRDLTVGSVTDQVWVFGKGYEFESDDHIDITWTNTDTKTYGLRVIYELI